MFIQMHNHKSSTVFILIIILSGFAVLNGCAVSPMSEKGNSIVSSDSEDRLILTKLSRPKRLAVVVGINESAAYIDGFDGTGQTGIQLDVIANAQRVLEKNDQP